MIDRIQKGSLAILLWCVIYVFIFGQVFDNVWPPQRRLAGRLNGTYAIDVTPPLPLIAWVLIYSIPTVIVAALVFLYRLGTRKPK